MGLDMFAFALKAELVGDEDTDTTLHGTKDDRVDVAYWRKFNHLHGWMHRLYVRKGGTDPDFNCNTVRLNEHDLDRLEDDAKNERLTATQGFFFGTDELHEEDMQSLTAFIAKARELMADGYAVLYDSWW